MTCFLTGSALLILGRFVPAATRPSSPIPKWTTVPLADQFELASPPSRTSSPSPILTQDEPAPPPSRTRLSRFWWRVAVLLSLCCVRIEVFRKVSLNSECAPTGYAVRRDYEMWPLQNIDDLENLVRHTICRLTLRLLVQPTIAAKGGIRSSTKIPGRTPSNYLFGLPPISLPIGAQSVQRHNRSCFDLHRWLRGLDFYGWNSIHLYLSGHSPRSSASTNSRGDQLAGGLGSSGGNCQSVAQWYRG